MKRLILGAAVLAASVSAQAALFTNAKPHEVCVPCLCGGFEFSLTGAWMDALYAQNYYAIKDTVPSSGQPTGDLLEADFDYDFAWGIMVGWIFANTGNDIRLTYSNFDNSEDDSATQDGNLKLWTTYGQIDDDYLEFAESASTSIDIETQGVDFEFGQHINIGCSMDFRLFAGVSYVDVDKDQSVHYLGDGSEGNRGTVDTKFDSEFTGWGPRIGFDTSYAFGGGFGFVTHFSAAIFYGDLDSESRFIDHDGEREGLAFVQYSDRDHLVPAFDVRIGLDYSYCFCNNTVLSVEAGYWAKTYINAVSYIDLTGQGGPSSPPPTFDNMIDHQMQDVSYGGFYLTAHVAV